MRKLSLLSLLLTFLFCTPSTIEYQVSVTSNPIEGGSIDPPTALYGRNEDVSFIASPNAGYEFDHWSGDAYQTEDTIIYVVINEEKNIIANFKLKDQEAPTIIVSPTTQSILIGEDYQAPVLIAIDDVDGDITDRILIDGEENIDSDQEGAYLIVYSVSDSAGNSATSTHIVFVEVESTSLDEDQDGVNDNLDQCPKTPTGSIVDSNGCPQGEEDNPPTISLPYESIILGVGESFTIPEATAEDDFDGDISDSVIVQGSVDTSNQGEYAIVYSVRDSSGNLTTVTLLVTVRPDTTPPLIFGPEEEVVLQIGETFSHPKVTALDAVNGDVSSSITSSGTVDTSVEGEYTVTYTAMDNAGNSASVTVIFIVRPDATPPTIQLSKIEETIFINGNFTPPTATASDNIDGDISSSVTSTSTIDTTTEGTYTIIYFVEDNAGNSATATFTLTVAIDSSLDADGDGVVNQFDQCPNTPTNTVVNQEGCHDVTPPVLTVNPTERTIEAKTTYIPPTVTASDSFDGNLNNRIQVVGESAIDSNIPGLYVVTYSVVDNAGHRATATFTLTVEDTTPPLIVAPTKTITLEVGETFVHPYIGASDGVDGDITSSITNSGTVDTSVLGTYIVTYAVMDSSENSASVDVTVIVRDSQAPLLTIDKTEETINLLESYTAPVVTAEDAYEGNLTAQIVESGKSDVDTQTSGTYLITYTVSDSSSNTASVTFTLNVLNTYSPNGDLDNDGVLNQYDRCQFTPQGTPINLKGCATPLYLDDNGKTVKLDTNYIGDATPGNSYGLDEDPNSQQYELVLDYTSLAEKISLAEDYTHICTSLITSTSALFQHKHNNIQDLSTWDVSNVQNMSSTFQYTTIHQDIGIGYWDVSSVTNMHRMFVQVNFSNKNFIQIEHWNVSNVINMEQMFFGATYFNVDIGGWDVKELTYAESMFEGTSFNQDISGWNVESMTDMESMFERTPFNKDIGNWNVSSVENMRFMFAESGFDQPIENWDVSNVTDMNSMFFRSDFNKSIENWNVSKVTDMSSMFEQTPFNKEIGNWNVSSVTNMERMFQQCQYFNRDLNNWDVSNVTNMSAMFFGAREFTYFLEDWNVSKVTNMGAMFQFSGLNQDESLGRTLSNWDVSNVTLMYGLFADTYFNDPIGNWNVSKVTSMASMFRDNPAFNRDISQWNVSAVTTMALMFRNAKAFNQNLSGWDVSNVTSYGLYDDGADFWEASNKPNFP